ncbi:response regulator [Asticcacaulis solisilvae]|uniref:response regulator n=1 Tax=Asticcacaulis solisilvae TaxID=1217274 RepID=UPI003FD76601
MGPVTEPKRVLLVEDDTLVAMLVEDMLDEIGYALHSNPATVPAALKAVADGGFDIAILDVNLAGQPVFPVAEALDAAGIPFVFASGYGAGGVPAAWAAHPIAAKPFRIDDLDAILAAAGARQSL